MAEKSLSFRIGATDDATRVVSKMSSTIKKEMSEVDDSFSETESKGEAVARALGAVFDQLGAELKATSETAEVMGDALRRAGSEMDASDAVSELRRLGLTLEQIEADADSLAAALKKGDDVAALSKYSGQADIARQKTDDLGKSAGSSKSVLANMIGNSVQDLGALGGIAGSTGVAFGQMGEYIADASADGDNLGQILRGFGGVAAPIAGIALATQMLSSAFEKGRKAAEMQAQGVERLTKAAEEGTGVLGALRDQIDETGKLSFTLGGGFDFAGLQVGDLRKNLDNLGLTLDDFAGFTEAGTESLEDYYQANKDVLGTNKDWVAAFTARDALNQQIAQSELDRALNTRIGAEADEAAAKASEDLLTAYIKTAGTAVRVAAATDDLTDSTDDAGESMDDTAAAADRLRRRTDELSAQWDALQGNLDDDSAFMSLQDQFRTTQMAAMVAWDTAAKGAVDAGEKSREYQWEVQRTKEQVKSYGEQIGLLPSQVETYLRLLDNGQIEEMERRLAILTRNRNVSLNIISRGGAGYEGGLTGARAGGGPVMAGESYLVNEDTPRSERFRPSVSGSIVREPTSGSGPAPVYMTNVFGPGMSDRDIQRALYRAERRYGGRR